MEMLIKKLQPDAILPKYALPGDAAMDIYSYETRTFLPGERGAVATGIAFALPKDHVGLVWDKSGPPLKTGMHTLAGVVDEGYRGELKIVVINHGNQPVTIEKGQKIAQFLIQPITRPEIKEVLELDQTARGTGGFGSTGLH